ncbi:hypothetical protein K2173_005982 [Erythroxylum novogranatense]|uniref:Uncharacterized protein n=1 Tax=Erythroxylum novogranatense TaxID=1862640 RepID=A0AAV8TBK5_9ROSI|nr:hypothetical protein K2173_005982 [Erythroxylum novogranatense]
MEARPLKKMGMTPTVTTPRESQMKGGYTNFKNESERNKPLATAKGLGHCFCSFPPQALARPNMRNPNHNSKNSKFIRNTKLKPQRAKHKSAPSLVTLTGHEATTYTRLPPREDFTVPLLGYSPQSLSAEVKFSNYSVAKMEDEIEVYRSGIEKGEESENSLEFNLHEDYGHFQVFGVGSDFDKEEEEVVYETVNGGTVNIYEGNGFGEEEGAKIEGVKEKGIPAVMRCVDNATMFFIFGF